MDLAMIVKKGADISNLSDDVKKAFPIIEEVCSIYQIEFVITAGRDGRHMKGSKHYSLPECEAIDIRTRDLSDNATRYEFTDSLRGRLEDEYPGEYDLSFEIKVIKIKEKLVESTHLHLEYDPK